MRTAIGMMKEGVVLLNFARDLLVDEQALVEALEAGKVKKYVTDFANPLVAGAVNTWLHRIWERPQRSLRITVL